jgi:hypothetical protein
MNDRIIEVKDKAKLSPKLSGLHGDPDYWGPDQREAIVFRLKILLQ